MCTMRPDVMLFYACSGMCAYFSPQSYNVGIISATTHRSRVSFNLTVIWKLLHTLWLFGLPHLMQKWCNLKCVVILIKFRWKWESLIMAHTELLPWTAVECAAIECWCWYSSIITFHWINPRDLTLIESGHWPLSNSKPRTKKKAWTAT